MFPKLSFFSGACSGQSKKALLPTEMLLSFILTKRNFFLWPESLFNESFDHPNGRVTNILRLLFYLFFFLNQVL